MYKEEISTIFIIFFCVSIFVVLAIVFLFMVFNNRKNKLIKENLEAALKNQKRQHELELKALRGQMNPHFVHNSLNAIQYYIQQNDVETSEDYLAKFSKLMRQFFDFSRRQSVTIKEEVSLLENYLDIEKLRFEDKIDYSITIDPKLDIEEEQIPSMILQPIIENAVNHGLFHKQSNGYVAVTFEYINAFIYKVCVIDDGIGINKTKALNTSIRKGNASHSSAVFEERLHFLKESSLWDIEFSIKDRSEYEQTTGTIVTLLFNHNQDG